jgi:hypothetical protein
MKKIVENGYAHMLAFNPFYDIELYYNYIRYDKYCLYIMQRYRKKYA